MQPPPLHLDYAKCGSTLNFPFIFINDNSRRSPPLLLSCPNHADHGCLGRRLSFVRVTVGGDPPGSTANNKSYRPRQVPSSKWKRTLDPTGANQASCWDSSLAYEVGRLEDSSHARLQGQPQQTQLPSMPRSNFFCTGGNRLEW